MSECMEIYGEIYFKKIEERQEVIDLLIEKGCMREDGDTYKWITKSSIDTQEVTPKDGCGIYFDGEQICGINNVLDTIVNEFDINREYSRYRTVCIEEGKEYVTIPNSEVIKDYCKQLAN